LEGGGMKLLIFIAVVVLGVCAQAQPITNDVTLNNFWQIALQVDTPTMASESEKKLGVKIVLPIEPAVAPSPALMQSGVGLTTWSFSRQNLEMLQTSISSVRYERVHYYGNNAMHYRLGIGVDTAKTCISADELKEFLIKRRKIENTFRYGGLMNLQAKAWWRHL
jgi:hypothetical protein